MLGEEISGEKEFFFRKENSAVAHSVAGKTDDFEPVDGVTGREPLIDFWDLEEEKSAADFFKPTTDPAPTTVAMLGLNVIPVEPRSVDPATGESLNSSYVEGVVEMSVSQDDASDVGPGFSMVCEGFFNPRNPSDKSAINEVKAFIRDDEMVLNNESSKLNNFAHIGSLPFFYEKPTMDAF